MPERITVFLSSKNHSALSPGKKTPTLSTIRARIKQEVEDEKVLGDSLFEVWINEDIPATGAHQSATDKCLQEVRDADIVIVLFNGDAGWMSSAGGLGICHAEFKEALNYAPEALRIVRLPQIAKAEKGLNAPFAAEIKQRNPFAPSANTGDEVVAEVKTALREAVEQLARSGARAMRGSVYHSGAPLAWARLDYDARAKAMVAELRSFLKTEGARSQQARPSDTVAKLTTSLASRDVRVICHAVPAAMTVATARERVGQPFLQDHLEADVVSGTCVGPVHLIACHQGVSESQALRQLGFPDAMILNAPFGVYVADGVQRVQMVFLKECRDEANTRRRCEQLFEWLRNEGEDVLLAERAARRAEIVRAMA